MTADIRVKQPQSIIPLFTRVFWNGQRAAHIVPKQMRRKARNTAAINPVPDCRIQNNPGSEKTAQ
jgi:hypothetical protein